jgi:hypothetical protein
VAAKLANRFYEPMVLLLALNQAYSHNRKPRTQDWTPEVPQSAEHDFHRFVDKLAQLCHNERGGGSITAFVVLKLPSHIQYQFASNQRKEDDLIRVRGYIDSILRILGEASTDTLMGMVSPILRKCLVFNRPRVQQIYVKKLEIETANCITDCQRKNSEDCKFISKAQSNKAKLLLSKLDTRKTEKLARTASRLG